MLYANTPIKSVQSKEVLSGCICFRYIYIQRPKYLETADGFVTHSENYGYTYSGKLSTVKAWAHALGFTHSHYSIVRTVLGVVLA